MKREIKVCIIDDEYEAQRVLQSHLERNFPQFKLIASESTYSEGLKAINTLKPDLVFLDINLSGESGIELAKEITSSATKVIFTTAYDEYTIDAIRVKAYDYLLKPIFKEDFLESVNRFIADQRDTKSETNGKQILSVSNHEGIHQLEYAHIEYVEAGGAYCTFVLQGGRKIVISKPLKNFSDVLSEENGFFRIHKSFLVSIRSIERYNMTDSIIVLRSGSELPVARPKRMALKKAIDNRVQ